MSSETYAITVTGKEFTQADVDVAMAITDVVGATISADHMTVLVPHVTNTAKRVARSLQIALPGCIAKVLF